MNKSSNYILGLVLLAFVAFKWTALSLPYFWDEAWSYIPAISQMSKNTPCLLPGCISTDLYRGHPLLFYFLASCWMKFISGSLFSMHMFATLISVLALISFYKLSQIFLSPLWAVFGVLILMIQEVFFVQSSFLLPEILLTLLTLEAIRNFLLGKKYIFLIYLGLLGLTKETGIIIILCFLVFHIIKLKGLKKDFFWLLLSMVPCGLFFVLQKIKFGWYFYPLHMDLIDLSFNAFKSKLIIILKFLFLDQGRKIFLFSLTTLLVYKLWQINKKVNLIPIIILILLTVLTLITNNIIILFLMLSLIFYYLNKILHFSELDKKLILLSSIIISIFILFSSLNFLMLRYLIFIIPLIIIALLIIGQKIIGKPLIFNYLLILVFIVNFGFSITNNFIRKEWHDDASINYYNIVKVHQQVSNYCELNNWYNKKILTHFLLFEDLTNENCGYLTSDSVFNDVSYIKGETQEYEIVILSCIEYDEERHNMIKNNPLFELKKRFEICKAWAEIYTLKSNIDN